MLLHARSYTVLVIAHTKIRLSTTATTAVTTADSRATIFTHPGKTSSSSIGLHSGGVRREKKSPRATVLAIYANDCQRLIGPGARVCVFLPYRVWRSTGYDVSRYVCGRTELGNFLGTTESELTPGPHIAAYSKIGVYMDSWIRTCIVLSKWICKLFGLTEEKVTRRNF